MVRATEQLLASVLGDRAELAVPVHQVRERLSEAVGDDAPAEHELVRRARRSTSLVVIDAPSPWDRGDWTPDAAEAYAHVATALDREAAPVIMRRPRPEDEEAPGPVTGLACALRASLLAIHDASSTMLDPVDDRLAHAVHTALATIAAARRLSPPVP